MADPLALLRQTIAANEVPSLLPSADAGSAPVEDIASATHILFKSEDGPTVFPLSAATRFVRKKGPVSEGGPVDLKAVYFCWVHRDENMAHYIQLCGEKDVVNLTFIERTSLVTWLSGADDDSEYIARIADASLSSSSAAGVVASRSGQTASASAPSAAQSASAVAAEQANAAARFKARIVDPRLERTYANERVLLNRNSVLRGVKQTDFTYVRKDAYENFIQRLKNRSAPSSVHRGLPLPSAAASQTKRRDPIILLSPSASSLLTMANIKDFLERGTYVPASSSSGAANLQMVSRSSGRLGNLRFAIVDSSDKFKPDYWDRVVAVFTTGQTWQFRSYKWTDPKELFQRVKGFCVTFTGDPVPENVRQWNVDVIQIDKIHRFRDRETVEGLWDRLEKYMEIRGFTGRRQR